MGLKKCIATGLSAILITLLTPFSSYAQTGTVTADSLNIRALASTSAQIISKVKSGTQLTLLSYDGSWYNIKTDDGITGYVSADYILPDTAYFGRVTASNLMVRSSTGTSSPIIAKLSCDSVVELLAYDGAWYKVLTEDGHIGYASADYIVLDDTITSLNSSVYDDLGYGYVSCALTRMHESTGEYSTVSALLDKGEKLQLLIYDGAWYKVRRENGEEGYVSVNFITLDSSSVQYIPDNATIPGYIDATSLNFRSEPNTTCNVISSLSKGTEINLLSYKENWFKAKLVNGSVGYVSADYISLNPVANAPVNTSVTAVNVPYVPKVAPTDETYSLGAKIIETAYEYLGTPYRYATEGPDSFDCSGFTMYVMNIHGIKLPHQSGSQYLYGFEVAKDELIPGDLVFFNSNSNAGVAHVGIYVGEGYFIHASSGRAYSVTVSSLSDDYYTTHYLGAKRVI